MAGRGAAGIRNVEGRGSALWSEAGLASVLAALVVVATAVAALADGAGAKLGAALIAVAVALGSALYRIANELARRRSHAPALKRRQAHRSVQTSASLDQSVASLRGELRACGFAVDRVEASGAARVLLATRGGWSFPGVMLVHGGVLVGVLAIALGTSPHSVLLLALGAAMAAVGIVLALACDPQVAWCAAQRDEDGTAIGLVVSACWSESRTARTADRLAARIDGRLAPRRQDGQRVRAGGCST